jgi:hypothetical protein
MGLTQGLLVKGYTAGAAIEARKVVKFDAADSTVIESDDANDFHIGVSAPDVDVAIGATVDVHLGGIVECISGGTVTRGGSVTADSAGDVVDTTTAGDRCIGFAEVSGVDGDIVTVFLAPHIYAAAA